MTNEEINKWLSNLKDDIGKVQHQELWHYAEAIEIAIEALKQTAWIPCSERLPEEDGLYLVTTSKGQVQVHVFRHNGNSEEYWMRCNKAWMPLPEPYREETE